MDVAARMIEGQMMELDHQNDLSTTVEVYMEIISLKTGALFAGIARIAASLDAGSEADPEQFESFGLSLGRLFQIRDDLIDIISSGSGKDRFRDLKEGKITLPFILLLRSSGSRARALLRARDYAAIDDLLRNAGVQKEVEERMSQLSRECKEFIMAFNPSPFRESLLGLIDFIGERNY